MPLIWPKRSLRDLPPLSSLHLCIPPSLPPSHQSPGRVNQRGGIAQQAIHRLDTLTNIPLSFSLPLSPSLSNFSIPPFLHVSWPLSKSNLALLLFSFPPSALLLDLLPPYFCLHFFYLPCALSLRSCPFPSPILLSSTTLPPLSFFALLPCFSSSPILLLVLGVNLEQKAWGNAMCVCVCLRVYVCERERNSTWKLFRLAIKRSDGAD